MALVDDVRNGKVVVHPNQQAIIDSVAFGQRLLQNVVLNGSSLKSASIKGKVAGSV